VPFNNKSREKAITISKAHTRTCAAQLSLRLSEGRPEIRAQVASSSQEEVVRIPGFFAVPIPTFS
jgi:hypothetical protein